MTATARRARLAAARDGRLGRWVIVAQGAAALAVSMGIGRFVYTPILPLMGREAGLSKSFGATLATANYAGYLLGALAGIVAPALARWTWVMRLALSASVATLALMPASHDHAAWFVLRFVGGGASALVFVFAVSTMLSHLRHADHLVRWGFGGVGAGIALSGVLVLITGSIWSWSAAWWSSALAALLTTGYSVGQILGPQIVRPLLHDGYYAASLVGAAIVLGAAVAAEALRVGFPPRVGAMVEPSRLAKPEFPPAMV